MGIVLTFPVNLCVGVYHSGFFTLARLICVSVIELTTVCSMTLKEHKLSQSRQPQGGDFVCFLCT